MFGQVMQRKWRVGRRVTYTYTHSSPIIKYVIRLLMSSNAKIWIGVVVVIVLVLLGWYWYSQNNAGTTSQTPSGQTSTNTTNGSPSGSATSDAALNQDSAAIDTQMSGLDSDNASMNQSFNDQPVSQSY